jgi:hypothetical protein
MEESDPGGISIKRQQHASETSLVLKERGIISFSGFMFLLSEYRKTRQKVVGYI